MGGVMLRSAAELLSRLAWRTSEAWRKGRRSGEPSAEVAAARLSGERAKTTG
jgi:heme-degrading monooxygenase HmoA